MRGPGRGRCSVTPDLATHAHGRFRAVLGAVLIAGASAVPGLAGTVRIELVPAEHWASGRPKAAHYLPEGTVRFYRAGQYEPSVTGSAGQPIELPPGEWFWNAEAPGYVAVEAGRLDLSAGTRDEVLVWPVVPACRIVPAEDPARWRGIERLDVVSLKHAHVTPVVRPGSVTSPVAIPAGPLIDYIVAGGKIAAVSRRIDCRTGAVVALEPPLPPARGRQAVVLRTTLPDARPDVGDLAVALRTSDPRAPVRAPDAAVLDPRRPAFFFLDIPAATDLRVELAHPALETVRGAVAAPGGGVTEANFELVRRGEIEVEVAWEPARPHRSAEIVLSRCGGRKIDPREVDRGRCRPVGKPLPLQEGTAAYRFPDLDSGFYVLDGRIDNERIDGLGNSASAYLAGGKPDEPVAPQRLVELHRYGHLLVDGDPVEGLVRLRPVDESRPPLEFRTDADLLYHLYWFGQLPDTTSGRELPAAAAERSREETRGLYSIEGASTLEACDAEGFCRLFHWTSRILGGGRLDLDLGPARTLVVEVRSERDDSAIPGATVAVSPAGSGSTLIVVDDEARETSSEYKDPLWTSTDSRGLARIRGTGSGARTIGARADGYLPARQPATLAASGETRVVVRLRPEGDERGEALLVATTSGTPLASALVLPIAPGGLRRLGCARASDASGIVRLPAECSAEASRLLVVHPEAIDLVTPDPYDPRTLFVTPARSPRVVTVTDDLGDPVPGVPVAVHFPGFVLTVDDLLFGQGLTGSMPFFLTDRQGQITLRGIGAAAESVSVGGEAFPLAAVPPGGTVRITAPRP